VNVVALCLGKVENFCNKPYIVSQQLQERQYEFNIIDIRPNTWKKRNKKEKNPKVSNLPHVKDTSIINHRT
jgi:hypothetical protein